MASPFTVSRFTPTKQGNPCQVCSDTTGKCRTTDTVHLCMTVSDEVPGFKYLGKTKDGLWSKYVLDDGRDLNWTEADRQIWQRQQQTIKSQRALAEKTARANSLDLITRDREYRKLLSQLTLSATDRKDLIGRGLTPEQIAQGMYRTVSKWQPLTQTLDYRLPGVSLDGRSLNVSGYGYLVPIFNADGLIVACQIRLRQAEDGRYRWLTSVTKKRPDGATPHLPNSELPIGVYRPSELKITESIGTTEGHLKPFITSQKLGQIVLGAAGGQFASSPETFKAQLDQVSAELGGCRLIIDYVDAGAIANPNVMRQLQAKWKLLAEWGYAVQVAWWEQFSKVAPDIDELQDYSLIQYLTIDEFLSLQHHLLIEPDVRLEQRYLGDLVIPKLVKLLCLKAPKDTGKTESIAKLVARYIYEMPILVLSHRKQLVQALCDRFGIESVYELKDDTGKLIGYGLCVDSLHGKSQARFNADDWHNALVIVDESEQVIWHTLNSGTDVSEHRISVLTEMQKLFSNVLNSDRGMVVLSDADLTNLSLDFVLGMANRTDIKPYLIQNDYKFEQAWTVYSYRHTTPVVCYAVLESNIAAGKRVIVHLDSQQVKGQWSGVNLETRLKAKFPNCKILLIDADTVANPDHPAYQAITKGLDNLITQYDVAICTPVVETGVSIDIKGHFDCVFGFFCGVTGEASARQALARLREPVERHIWLKSYGLGRVANGATSAKSILSSDRQNIKAHIRQLQDAALADIETNPVPVALMTWGKMAARHNAGVIKFRQSVELGLTADGHRVIDVDQDGIDTGTLAEEMTANRDANYLAEREAIAVAAVIDDIEAEKLQEQKSRTQAENRQLHKHKLQKRYGISVKPDLVAADDQGFYSKLRLHYYMTNGREYLPARDKAKLDGLRKDSNKLWSPTANKALLGAKIALLEELGIPKLFNLDQGSVIKNINTPTLAREFRGTDADLMDLAELAISKRFVIKSMIGITIAETDSPILVAKRLLGVMGVTLTRTGRDKVNGKVGANIYRLLPENNDTRQQVFSAWLDRDIAKVSQLQIEEVPNAESDQGSVIKNINTPTLDRPISDFGEQCRHAISNLAHFWTWGNYG